jgi:hypothetical protein
MPNCITIITPIKLSSTERCRQYLRDNAEPQVGMQCKPKFGFDRIPNLHFASFVILDAAADFEPSLVFEATFDGSKGDFVSDLLQVAGNGMYELYQHCIGYPAAALTTPELAKEYLIDHDAGTDIYFSGSPGRTVGEIKGESRIHSRIVNYFSRLQGGDSFAPRLNGLFSGVRAFITRRESRRWAEQQAPVPWEVRFRSAIAYAAGFAAAILACLTGFALAVVYDWPLAKWIAAFLKHVDSVTRLAFGSAITLPPELFLAIGLAFVWVGLRWLELLFSSRSKHPRDQFFKRRIPLHVLKILRYGVLVFLAGAIVLALIPGMGKFTGSLDLLLLILHVIALGFLVYVLARLQYMAATLKISVELKKLYGQQENRRRLRLDLIRFAMGVAAACGVLLISHYVPPAISEETGRLLIHWLMMITAYGLIGALAFYSLGLLLLIVVRVRELLDERKFADPAALEARAVVNAKKYAREEGGNNRFQNHLASLTRVKPGLVHAVALRATLFVINLLSRFWFNVGTLGNIPTILSARWVLIDGGRRLLFLDNYGGAWDSYLNEFIDMTAVKGLNAIWTNTFVEIEGRQDGRYSFPETRFYFWKGAQAEQPFKAYVRESQIETIVWYSAYPTLSVVNINTSTAARQSLSKPLAPYEIDAVVQNL